MYIIKSKNGNIIKASEKTEIQEGDKVWYVNLPFWDYCEFPVFPKDVIETTNKIIINKQQYQMNSINTTNINVSKKELIIGEYIDITVSNPDSVQIKEKSNGRISIIQVGASKKICFNEAGIYILEAVNLMSNRIMIRVSDDSIVTELGE